MNIENIETAFKAVDKKIDHGMHLIDTGLDAFFHGLNKGFKSTFKAVNVISDNVFKALNTIGPGLRFASMPWGMVFPKGYLRRVNNKTAALPIFQPGIHMIRAKVGGGKSLLSFVLAEMELERTGYPSYFTSPVEKPRLSEDGKYWYVMHRVIDLKNYYKDGKKVLQFNTSKYKRINKDERHLQYPPRMNKSKEYNNQFIIEHEDHLLMRHDGMDWIGMYSQHMKMDSLDMDSLTYMHEVSTYKTIKTWQWIKDGLFNIIPTKLKLESYVLDINFEGQMTRKLKKRYSLKVSKEILDRYDTHAESHKHAGIKKDY